MRRHWPTLREGETLFPEFDSYRYGQAQWEPYDQLRAEITSLSQQLHAQTKFAKLFRWRAANLHYVVVEEGVAEPHELPDGWGLLVRSDESLNLVTKPVWQDAPESNRWNLLLRIALSGTRAVHASLGIRHRDKST